MSDMSDSQAMTSGMSHDYPARLDIDYPEEGLSRIKTLFRIVLIIPIFILAGLVTGQVGVNGLGNGPIGGNLWLWLTVSGLFLPTVLMILFRQKYPRWWFDWNLEVTRFSTRVWAYMLLLREEYPSTEEQQAIHLELDYPDATRDLNRGLPIVKWILAIPHYISIIILSIPALLSVIVAWFAIIFTGRYPRTLFDFVVGLNRWSLRVSAYMWLLTTDRYPPFSLK